ncbi:hypothetical protein PHMEG_00017721 [Phytophthora megakarya]|uniref:GRIP domain-containing protein n=1 Tax=Phytophthora megakarya TaxID=4795 RepID=A0A225VVT0_9STRA|nr:hypothetical protein PHMEG_00017721 [Phytophthora megakarya]
MWSRLTEGLADIVAPEESEELGRDDEDQLWNRFAAVVAPPPASPSAATPSVAAGSEGDEQEQYICELERALLQRKKQNEALEKKIRELEHQAGEERNLNGQLKELEVEIAQQKATIARLQGAHEVVTSQTEEGPAGPVEVNRLILMLYQAAALATHCQAYENELILLRDRMEELRTANETLQDDERESRSRAAEYEQGYIDLLAEIEKMKTTNEEEKVALMAKNEEHASSIDSQRLYDLEARLTTSEADKAVAQRDVERLQRDLNSLADVLHQFQVDSKTQKERVAVMEMELEHAKKELHTKQPLPEPTDGETNELERVMQKLVKKTHECEQLREALESTATQYNAERDVLDKKLAAQLVVAYVDSTKKSEVLHLIARMMSFTEEQKRRVGLGYPIEGNGGGGLFSSIIGLVAAPGDVDNEPADSSSIGGKSFADMWSEFLLDEASKGK